MWPLRIEVMRCVVHIIFSTAAVIVNCGAGDTSCVYIVVSSLRKKKVFSSYIVCFISLSTILKTLLTSIFLALTLNSLVKIPNTNISSQTTLHQHILYIYHTKLTRSPTNITRCQTCNMASTNYHIPKIT